MKTSVTSQQLSFFREHGRIRFENYPLDFEKVKGKGPARDLFRGNPFLKKLILYTLGPIALELTKQPRLVLACDQWIETPPTTSSIQDAFCFQGLACFFVFSFDLEKGTILDIFEPSSLSSHLASHSYLIAFGLDTVRIIENKKDPFNLQTRNLGYVYGDRLENKFHPLILPHH